MCILVLMSVIHFVEQNIEVLSSYVYQNVFHSRT